MKRLINLKSIILSMNGCDKMNRLEGKWWKFRNESLNEIEDMSCLQVDKSYKSCDGFMAWIAVEHFSVVNLSEKYKHTQNGDGVKYVKKRSFLMMKIHLLFLWALLTDCLYFFAELLTLIRLQNNWILLCVFVYPLAKCQFPSLTTVNFFISVWQAKKVWFFANNVWAIQA